MKFFEILNQPYPLKAGKEYHRAKLREAVLFGLFVWLFLVFFQPFNISNWSHPQKQLYLAIFGLITTFSLLFIWFVVFGLFPNFFSESKWTVAREIILLLLIIGLITLLNTLFGQIILINELNFYYFIWMFISVLAIGIFPIGIGVLTKYSYLNQKYSQPSTIVATQQSTDQQLIFMAESGKEQLKINHNAFLYAASADNYTAFFTIEKNDIKQTLLRGSLSFFETQSNQNNLQRCHRSYLVNMAKVERVSGNAQGYKFWLLNDQISLPVSRNYSHLVKSLK